MDDVYVIEGASSLSEKTPVLKVRAEIRTEDALALGPIIEQKVKELVELVVTLRPTPKTATE